jgi:hypothetical protein
MSLLIKNINIYKTKKSSKKKNEKMKVVVVRHPRGCWGGTRPLWAGVARRSPIYFFLFFKKEP